MNNIKTIEIDNKSVFVSAIDWISPVIVAIIHTEYSNIWLTLFSVAVGFTIHSYLDREDIIFNSLYSARIADVVIARAIGMTESDFARALSDVEINDAFAKVVSERLSIYAESRERNGQDSN